MNKSEQQPLYSSILVSQGFNRKKFKIDNRFIYFYDTNQVDQYDLNYGLDATNMVSMDCQIITKGQKEYDRKMKK